VKATINLPEPISEAWYVTIEKDGSKKVLTQFPYSERLESFFDSLRMTKDDVGDFN
jgi:hypothetical protein